MRFKRNQVEEAISGMYHPGASAPSTELRTKLKRLLETDRNLGRSMRSTDPERANFAFFSAESPGSGVEVQFSEYEAFALFTAWRLLEHGWPQASAVSILRLARPRLQQKHTEILKKDPAVLFDEKKIRESARPGSVAVSTTNPAYLVIASRQGRPIQRSSDDMREVRILEEDELMRFLRSEVGLSTTNFELVKAAHELRRALMKTTPSKRGRASG
jgi:hypothetical protein